MRHLTVYNFSSLMPAATLADYAQAVQHQLNYHLAPAWGLAPTTIGIAAAGSTPPTSGSAWQALFFDDADQAGALGYHDETPAGLIVQKIFVRTSQQDGISVSSVFSHEACEAAVDPTINRLADDYNGKAWALEVGDPVQRDSYHITVADGKSIQVSNFAKPQLFDPQATSHFDYMGTVHEPFGLSPGGYGQWTSDLQNWNQVGADLYAGHSRPQRG